MPAAAHNTFYRWKVKVVTRSAYHVKLLALQTHHTYPTLVRKAAKPFPQEVENQNVNGAKSEAGCVALRCVRGAGGVQTAARDPPTGRVKRNRQSWAEREVDRDSNTGFFPSLCYHY
ncbi:hypothetical protein TRVL_05437 [Trypanosoma vivax]|nr:hypothetical protein TRVL_05437 [Trypanosoma vivax]